MRVLDFDNEFSPQELAQALRHAGFSSDTTLQQVLDGKVEDVDDGVTLSCSVDEDDVLEKLGDEAIITAYRDLGLDSGNERAIEDGLRYVRGGDLHLATAMFERVFEGADLRAAERALS